MNEQKNKNQKEELQEADNNSPELIEFTADPVKDEDENEYIPWSMYPSEQDFIDDGKNIHQIKYDVYIYGPILEPFVYTRLFHIIRNTTEDDVIVIHINTPGGSINTLTAFINILNESKAYISCINDGFAESAGAILLFAGNEFHIPPHSIVLFHNMRISTAFQDTGLLKNNLDCNQILYNNLLKELCSVVLTPAEIKAITTKGYELSLTGKEIYKRLEKMSAIESE